MGIATSILLVCIEVGVFYICYLAARSFWAGKSPLIGIVQRLPLSPAVRIMYLRFTGLAPFFMPFGFSMVVLYMYTDLGWEPRAIADSSLVLTFFLFLPLFIVSVVGTLSGHPRILVPEWLRALESGGLPAEEGG